MSSTPAVVNPTAIESPTKSRKRTPVFTGNVQYDFPYSDAGNAELLVHLFGANWRYDHRQQRWLEWDSHRKRWHEDMTNRIGQLAIQAARHRRDVAAKVDDRNVANKMFQWATASENQHRIYAAVDLAKGLPAVANSGREWDGNPWLFGVANGVIDLQCGQLRDERPEDWITKHSPVRYDESATCPRFLSFIEEVMCRDAELVDYMQRALGYCLTGMINEQCLFCWYGSGANGKSTLMKLWSYLLGQHHVNLPFSALETKSRNSTDLAGLPGTRFATAVETSEGTRLNEARIKAMTGGDLITARRMYKDSFTFDPTHKLVLAFNHKPTIADDSEGMWRRVHLIPFNRYFEEGERDTNLVEKLKEEAPGILAWAVRGCLMWQKDGLRMPPAVKEATTLYRDESDHVGEFLSDCCELEPTASVSFAALWQRYQQWVHQNEEIALNKAILGERLARRGFVADKIRGERCRRGLKLTPHLLEPR